MKVLLINGSPHKQGNTHIALSEIAKTLEGLGIEAEIVNELELGSYGTIHRELERTDTHAVGSALRGAATLYHLFYETTRGEVEVEVAATPQLIRSTEGDTDIVQTLLRFRFLSSDGICDVGSKAGISQSALNAPPVIKAIAEGEAEPDGLVVIHKFAAVDEIGRHERILIGLLVFITYVTVITSPFILRFRTWSILEFGDIIELRTT